MRYNKSVYKCFAMITQVGISMMVPIFLCAYVGAFLDNKFGWYTFIPLVILGILAGFRNVYYLVRHANEDENDRRDDSGQ